METLEFYFVFSLTGYFEVQKNLVGASVEAECRCSQSIKDRVVTAEVLRVPSTGRRVVGTSCREAKRKRNYFLQHISGSFVAALLRHVVQIT